MSAADAKAEVADSRPVDGPPTDLRLDLHIEGEVEGAPRLLLAVRNHGPQPVLLAANLRLERQQGVDFVAVPHVAACLRAPCLRPDTHAARESASCQPLAVGAELVSAPVDLAPARRPKTSAGTIEPEALRYRLVLSSCEHMNQTWTSTAVTVRERPTQAGPSGVGACASLPDPR